MAFCKKVNKNFSYNAFIFEILRKGSNMNEYFVDFYDSPLEKMVLFSDGANLTGLYFDSSVNLGDFGANLCEISTDSQDIFTRTKEWLDLYFGGKNPQFAPPLKFPDNASHFALRVWEILQGIHYGKTTTYGKIAKQIAREFGIVKMSAQAVGGAVGRNPISIIVPCHRVIGVNGNITGYAGGIDKKLALLRLEGIALDSLKMPKNKA